MTRIRAYAGFWVALLVMFASAARAAEIDPATSQIGFLLTTRWGQLLEGRFPEYRGEIADLGNGRHRVRLELSARSVEIAGHSRYTRLTRGRGFFDAAHYPQVEFLSDAYPTELLHHGGSLPGLLTIRDVHRHEVFTIAPATCAAPGRDCDVVVSGRIRRSDYGMGRWSFAMSDDVRFALRVRVRDGTP